MKIVLQRVLSASVEISGSIYSSCTQGYLLFVGFAPEDTEDILQKAIKRILKLKLFSNDSGAMGLSLNDVSGEILIVSQFTLYAETQKGTKPSFSKAANPVIAELMYLKFIEIFKQAYLPQKIRTGIFGADMKVQLINEGPVTLLFEF
jgi:D-tyrosyl-tRNA(Tyr) deacylase